MKSIWLSLALLCALAIPAFGQGNDQTVIQFQQGGTNVMFGTGYFKLNFSSGCTATQSGNTLNIACTGGAGNPGGSANQIQYNLAGTSFSGFTMSQDCTLVVATGAITCTKTNNVAFGPFATQTSPCTVAEGCTGTTSTLTGIVRGGSPMTASELSGDVSTSGSNVATLATVNPSGIGSFTCSNITANGKGLITAIANGSCVPSGTVGQVLTENNSGSAVFTSNLIDNSQSGGTGVTLVGPVTFSGSAFQWYGTATPAGALSCGANAEGFGSDTSNQPSWCNPLGTTSIFDVQNLGPMAVGYAISSAGATSTGGTGSPNAYAVTTITPTGSTAAPFLFTFYINISNTTNVTLALNGGTAYPLDKNAGASLVAGDLPSNYLAVVLWNPNLTFYQLLNPATAASGSGSVTSIATSSPIGGGTITTTGTISCATCVTSAASLTSTALMTGAGSQGSQTPSATSTLSAGGNMSLAGTLTVTSTLTADGLSYPTSLTSGGVLYNSSSTAIASSGALANGQFVLGGGAGGAPTTSFSVVPNSNGGTGQNSSGSTGVAQVNSGTWSFSTALANGTTATTQSLSDNTTKVATDAFVLANSVTNPCSAASIGSLIYQGSSTLQCLAAPTAPTGVPNIVSTIPGSAPTYGPASVPIDAQSTASYSLATSDRANVVQTTNSTTSTALTVASPASTGYAQGLPFVWLNTGSVVGTATTTASNINGNATLKMVGAVSGHNPEASFWYNDGTNWWGAEVLPTDANGRLGCEGLMALTGDVTNTAGNCATTVGQVNGAAVPASATLLASNSSHQIIAAALTSADVYVGNGSNLPVGVAISGDSTMTNAGVMTNTGINGATIPASAFFLGSNGSSQLVQDQPFVVNAQTTTYPTVAADWAGCKTISIASGTFTVTLLASAPASGQCIWIQNYGSGSITVARNGLTINGAASNITIGAGSASAPLGAWIVSTGSNYVAQTFSAGGGVSSVNTLTGAVVIEAATAGQMAVSGGNAAALTGAPDMTYATHTFSTITTGIFDWSAATGVNSLKFPAIIGGTVLNGTSTANFSAPIVITDTNSTNNNTSITMGITAPGTSTGQTVLNVNGTTTMTTGYLLNMGVSGTWASGVLSGQTFKAGVDAGGSLYQATDAIGSGGTTQTLNPLNGSFQTITLSANLTISFTQPANGSTIMRIKITQAAGGNDTVTWTSVKWPGGIAPVMTATANAIDWYSCMLDGTNTWCTAGQNFQ